MAAPSVTVVDLGLGNLASVARAVTRAGGRPEVTSDPSAVARAERLLLPGQGGFQSGADALDSGFRAPLLAALSRSTPLLGICLGMQLLFEGSEEAEGAKGLAWVKGHVRAIPITTGRKIPHMGWNQVTGEHPFIPSGEYVYFAHSFVARPEDSSVIAGTFDYPDPMVAAVTKGSAFACQFHPEKSGPVGLQILRSFLKAT